MNPNTADDGSCSSISIDSDVAFAFIDFSGVNFGDDDVPKNTTWEETDHVVEISSIRQQNNPEKYQKQKGQDAQQPIEMPDGQKLQEQHLHDPQLFTAQSRRIQNLCKWHELGIRPSLSSSSLVNLAAHQDKDDDLFASEVDDMPKLLLRSIQAQDDLNTNLPPHPLGKYEDSLKVAVSTIVGAGNGLFATKTIPKGAIVCNYTGYRHHYQSIND